VDLKVTLTVQMQAPHSEFLCPGVAPAVMLCKNHNSHFCTVLLGTLCCLWAPSVELLQNLVVLVTSSDTVVSWVSIRLSCPCYRTRGTGS